MEILQRCAASGGSVCFSIVCDAMPFPAPMKLPMSLMTLTYYSSISPYFPPLFLALVVDLCSVRVTGRLSARARLMPRAWLGLLFSCSLQPSGQYAVSSL